MELRNLFNTKTLVDDSEMTNASGETGHLSAAEKMISAGQEAIKNVMSTNSQDFLNSNRQEGGQ